MRLAWCGMVAGLLASLPANAEPFRVEDLRAHRTAAVDAVKSGDLDQARTQILLARDLVPSAPSVLLLGARIELAAGRPDAARMWLNDYLTRGLWFDPAAHPDLAGLLDGAGLVRLSQNGSDFGAFDVVASIPAPDLVESVARDADGQLYFTTVRNGALRRLEPAYTMHDLAGGLGAYGLAVREGRALVAVSPGEVSGRSAAVLHAGIEEIDLRNGRVQRRYGNSADRRFGDIALGREGLYISEGSGEVLRLNLESGVFDTLIPSGRLGSPQGLAESSDGRTLIVADYTTGLWRLDLDSGEAAPLPVPADVSLIGSDGLVRHNDDLIVVQNGVHPARVLRVRLTPDWRAVESVQVLLRGGELNEPTTGFVADGAFVFVARSQWTDFTETGDEKPSGVRPAVIGRLRLE